MKYVCLVYGEEKHLHALTADGGAKLDADSLAYDRLLAQQGKLIIAQALQPVKTAKTVRRRKGKQLLTDGPFAETKEQLLGFVMVEAATLEEALDIAAGIPLAELGMIEVRAVYDVPGS
ncbi:YciI family protein [Mesorhizobium sp. ES1-4]|uniref:YciI family protein n=1 Tax=Mesorhizobium sp. ES1-4 TaxID=2876627 RepID=UPI001CCCFC4A|nr:YciI family protein [Mesorhizobium sp. ES1-4]MBZ9797053.1 YciI family protein [Mesorhizobium sp. ES1-4]